MWHGKPWRPQAPRPRNSAVPSSRSAQSSGVCPQPRLVRVRLGGGAAPGPLRTPPQEAERERQAHQPVGLRALGPEALPTVYAVDLRQDHPAGAPRGRPVRRPALSLPSAGTQHHSGGGQPAGSAGAGRPRRAPARARVPLRPGRCRVWGRGSCHRLSPGGAALRRGARRRPRPRAKARGQSFSLRGPVGCRGSLWRPAPRHPPSRKPARGGNAHWLAARRAGPRPASGPSRGPLVSGRRVGPQGPWP
jgi:hypothetical protein